MLDDLGQYVLELADNWAAFMTGGLLSALVLVIERVRKNTISVWLFVLLFLVFGFAASSFTTWRNEHAARVKAEQMPKGRNPATVRQLQDFYADAASYYREVSDAKTDREFQELKAAINKWGDKLRTWTLLNMGTGASVRIIQPSKSSPPLDNAKTERAELLRILAIVRDNLAAFVESPAWDKP